MIKVNYVYEAKVIRIIDGDVENGYATVYEG